MNSIPEMLYRFFGRLQVLRFEINFEISELVSTRKLRIHICLSVRLLASKTNLNSKSNRFLRYIEIKSNGKKYKAKFSHFLNFQNSGTKKCFNFKNYWHVLFIAVYLLWGKHWQQRYQDNIMTLWRWERTLLSSNWSSFPNSYENNLCVGCFLGCTLPGSTLMRSLKFIVRRSKTWHNIAGLLPW